MKKKLILFIILVVLPLFSLGKVSLAEESSQVDYGEKVIVDSDLDGLTDLGEEQLFKTNPQNPDTDNDGFLDGVEVINKIDPLDASFPRTKETTVYFYPENEKTLWSWYLSRSGGLVSFLLLYLSIFFGLSIRLPFIRKIIQPIESLKLHEWLSVQALLFVFIHSLVLLGDEYMKFSLKDIFVPLASSWNPVGVTLGVLAMYLMLALTVSSYLRKYISYKIWRWIHSLNSMLYIFAIYHAWTLGTDFKNLLVQEIFIVANGILGALILIFLSFEIKKWLVNKFKRNEDIRQSEAQFGEK